MRWDSIGCDVSHTPSPPRSCALEEIPKAITAVLFGHLAIVGVKQFWRLKTSASKPPVEDSALRRDLRLQCIKGQRLGATPPSVGLGIHLADEGIRLDSYSLVPRVRLIVFSLVVHDALVAKRVEEGLESSRRPLKKSVRIPQSGTHMAPTCG